MKKVGYQVVAQFPVCVDFDDNTSVSYQKGQTFCGDTRNPQIARLLRIGSIRQLADNEAQPTALRVGLSSADASLMKAHDARKLDLKNRAAAPTVAAPTTQKKGEVVSASTLKPEKK